MTVRRPLVRVGGRIRQLPVGDTLPGVRELLTAARTYYVRTDGNDSNDGLSNAAGGAFLTIQRAINIASSFDLNGNDILISVANGTYPENLLAKTALGSGMITIRGNTSTPASVVISSITSQTVPTPYAFEGMSLTNGSAVLRVSAVGASISIANLVIGVAGYAHVASTAGATIVATGPLTFSGNAAGAIYAGTGGRAEVRGRAVTLSGTPSFSNGFAFAQIGGSILLDGCTFSGTATGPRYAVATNSTIFVNAAGASYLPGNAAGTNDGTGAYA